MCRPLSYYSNIMSTKNKNRFLVYLVIIFLSSYTYIAKAQTTHAYALGLSYYYLKVYGNNKFEIKVGMYKAKILKGEYFLQGDTLNLINFKFPENNYSEKQQQIIQNNFGKCIVHDSLLIPKMLYGRDIKPVHRATRDSNLIYKYLISDGHVHYEMNLNMDSVFNYRTGSDRWRTSINGKWNQKKDLLYLYPESDEHSALKMICTDNVMVFFDEFLVGKVAEKDEIIYLIKR